MPGDIVFVVSPIICVFGITFKGKPSTFVLNCGTVCVSGCPPGAMSKSIALTSPPSALAIAFAFIKENGTAVNAEYNAARSGFF